MKYRLCAFRSLLVVPPASQDAPQREKDELIKRDVSDERPKPEVVLGQEDLTLNRYARFVERKRRRPTAIKDRLRAVDIEAVTRLPQRAVDGLIWSMPLDSTGAHRQNDGDGHEDCISFDRKHPG